MNDEAIRIRQTVSPEKAEAASTFPEKKVLISEGIHQIISERKAASMDNGASSYRRFLAGDNEL